MELKSHLGQPVLHQEILTKTTVCSRLPSFHPDIDPPCFSGFIFRHTASGQNPETGFYALYDLGNQLGRGSFASVVHCMDRATGIFWAAKIFSNTIGIGDGSLSSRTDKMVSREISILQKLRHPNICFLKDTFILEDGKLSRTLSSHFWDHSDDV